MERIGEFVDVLLCRTPQWRQINRASRMTRRQRPETATVHPQLSGFPVRVAFLGRLPGLYPMAFCQPFLQPVPSPSQPIMGEGIN